MLGSPRRWSGEVTAHECHDVGDHAREAIEQILEGHRWPHEVRRLCAKHRHELLGVEVEQVAEELWGTRTVRLRVPRATADLPAMRRYAVDRVIDLRATKAHVVVTLSVDEEGGGGWVGEDGDGWMQKLLGLRKELMAGDHRALYLGWLAATLWGDLDEDEREPAVPPGLRRLTKAQAHLADFLALDDDLVEAAAQASRGGAVAATPTKAALAKWVAALPANQKDAWLVAAALDDGANVGTTLLQAYRKAQPKAAAAGPAKAKRRTVAELFAAAGRGTAEG